MRANVWARARGLFCGILLGFYSVAPVADGGPVPADFHEASVADKIPVPALLLVQPGKISAFDPDELVASGSFAVSAASAATAEVATGNLWFADNSGLQAYDSEGHQLLEHPIPLPGGEKVSALAVDAERGILWAMTGSGIHRYAVTGQHLSSTSVKAAKQLALLWASGQTWLLAEDALFRFEPNGELSLELDSPLAEILLAFASSEGKDLWLAGRKEVVRLDKDGALVAGPWSHPVNEPKFISDDGNGGIWISGKNRILHIDAAGRTIFDGTVGKGAMPGKGAITFVAADSRDGGAWFGLQHDAWRLTASGAALGSVSVRGDAISGGLLHVDVSSPEIWINAPASGSHTNNTQPRINVAYRDFGSRVLPDTLSFTANDEVLDVDCETSLTDGDCLPASPFMNGEYELVSRIDDAAGNAGQSEAVTFTIDTVPPVISIESPNTGLVTNQAEVFLSGFLDEWAAMSLDGAELAIDEEFSFQAVLQLADEGANSFEIEAVDRAGNATGTSLQVIRDTVAPATLLDHLVSIEVLADGTIRIRGEAGAAEPGSTLRIIDPLSGETYTVLVSADGSFDIGIPQTSEVSIAVVDAADNVSPETTLSLSMLPPDPAAVAPSLDTTVATTTLDAVSFLFSGDRPVQLEADESAFKAAVIGVVRGRVLAADGSALPGAKVSVKDHPEFGYTLSRADGWFDLAVNAGGAIVLDYSKENFLHAQRLVETEWQDFVHAPDVRLVALDPQVSTIHLAGQTQFQVAQGSVVTDHDGTRQAVILFPPGTQATMHTADGGTRQLDRLDLRITEYTVGVNGPQAMPADLNPPMAYTYAAEISVDEALEEGVRVDGHDVVLNQPVFYYLDNFIGLPVGMAVPAGSYDFDAAQWRTDRDGAVLKILAETEGKAVVDIQGKGLPAAAQLMADWGFTDEELQLLAARYEPGDELWRVPMISFSPKDLNQPARLPEDAIAPEAGGEDGGGDKQCQSEESGSIVLCESQTLAEEIALPGVPFTLRYQSDRVPDRRAEFTWRGKLTGEEIPFSLKKVVVEFAIAGQRLRQEFEPAPNLEYTFEWDGKDAYGRVVNGPRTLRARIGYQYQTIFTNNSANPSGASFGQRPGGVNVMFSENGARDVGILWRAFESKLGVFQAGSAGIGGWTLDAHHQFAAEAGTLFRGDGREVASEDFEGVVRHVAGRGCTSYAVQQGAARSVCMSPRAVAAGSSGEVYFAQPREIGVVDPDGMVRRLAWISAGVFSSLRYGKDRQLYAVVDNRMVYRLDENGELVHIAGNGGDCYWFAPGKQATQTCFPQNIDVDASVDGSVYLAVHHGWDGRQYAIVRIGADGIARTWYDSGRFGGYGNSFWDISVGEDGSIYHGGGVGRTIYRFRPDGSRQRVAGGGASNLEGAPAVKARLEFPNSFRMASNGEFVIADYSRFRKVKNDGTIHTVQGGGSVPVSQFDGTPGYLTAAVANSAQQFDVDPAGNTWFTTGHRIFVVRDSLVDFTGEAVTLPSDDGSEVFEFDSLGKHLRTRHAQTGAVLYEFGYSAQGLLESITDADGHTTRIEHSAGGRPTAIVGPYGQRHELSTDSNGWLDRIESSGGDAWEMEYTTGGLLKRFEKPRGHASHFSYDPQGRLEQDIDAAGSGWQLSRENRDSGYVATLTSVEGRQKRFDVQPQADGGTLRITTHADGSQSQLRIEPRGQRSATAADGTVTHVVMSKHPRFGMDAPLAKQTTVTTPSGNRLDIQVSATAVLAVSADPLSVVSETVTRSVNGNAWQTTFTAATRSVESRSPEGRETRSVIDAVGRPLLQQVNGLADTHFTYDTRGRLESIVQQAGDETRETRFDYHADGAAAGYLEGVTDPLLREVRYEYDASARIERQQLPGNREIAYDHDANGNLVAIAPPGKPAHAFDYTDNDLEQRYSPPALGGADVSTRYDWNRDKQLEAVTRPDGRTIDYVYAPASGRLDRIDAPVGSYTLGYDSVTGQLEQLGAPGGEQLAFGHDGFLTTSVTSTGTVNGSVAYGYDNHFRLDTLAVNGQAVSFGYDRDNLLVQAGDLVLARDAANGLLQATTLGTVSSDPEYNAFAELDAETVTVGGAVVYAVDYERDRLGRITQKTETVEGVTTTVAYTYDDAGRLDTVSRNGSLEKEFGYDANGNRTHVNGIEVGVYDAQDRLLSYDVSVGGTTSLSPSPSTGEGWGEGACTFSYTLNGELDRRDCGGQVLDTDYDVFGNLRRAVIPGPDPESSPITTDYVIDGQNRRIGKKIDGVLVQGFLYQDQLNPVAELDGAGNIKSRFVYADKPNIPSHMLKDGNTYRIVSDHLGSPRLVIDVDSGEIVQRMDYDAWGNVTEDSNPGFQPFGFAGGIYDRDTGLVRFGARDYDPVTGRWTAKDPIGLNGGINFYEYCQSDPINCIDPIGLDGYWNNVKSNFVQTNNSIPGVALPVGAGIATAGVTGSAFGLPTMGEALGWLISHGAPGGIEFALYNSAINFVLMSVAFESGILVGSMINAIPVGCGMTVRDSVSGLFERALR